MLTFKQDYAQAMRDQAPAMFNQLRRSGALEGHLTKKVKEAQDLFKQLANGMERLPDSGVLASAADEALVTEQVYATLMEFPPTADAPEDPVTPNRQT